MKLKIKKHISILLAGMLLFVTMPLQSYAGDELDIEYLTKKQSKTFDSAFKKSEFWKGIVYHADRYEDENNLYLFDEYGKIISDKYQEFEYSSEGLVAVKKDDKWGYIDKSGNEVIACKYDDTESFSEGLAWVEKDDKWGYIDKSGNEVIACKYDDAESFSEGLAWVEKDDKYGFVDKSGNEVIACKYDDAESFSEGLAPVEKDGKWGYIDKNGNEVIAFKYDYVGGFSEGLALVLKDGKWDYIDKSEKEGIACQYDGRWHFSEGLAMVLKDDKWGYIDKSGKEVITCKYDDAWHFSEGLAMVSTDDKGGVIDKKGNKVIWFESTDHFDNHALIKYHGRWGFVEKEYLVLPATQKIIEKGIQRDKMMKVAVPAVAFVAIILIPGMLVLYLKKKKRKAAEFSNEGVYADETQAMGIAGYCTNCGKPYSNSTQFCGGCGQKLQKRQEE